VAKKERKDKLSEPICRTASSVDRTYSRAVRSKVKGPGVGNSSTTIQRRGGRRIAWGTRELCKIAKSPYPDGLTSYRQRTHTFLSGDPGVVWPD